MCPRNRPAREFRGACWAALSLIRKPLDRRLVWGRVSRAAVDAIDLEDVTMIDPRPFTGPQGLRITGPISAICLAVVLSCAMGADARSQAPRAQAPRAQVPPPAQAPPMQGPSTTPAVPKPAVPARIDPIVTPLPSAPTAVVTASIPPGKRPACSPGERLQRKSGTCQPIAEKLVPARAKAAVAKPAAASKASSAKAVKTPAKRS